MIDKKTINSLEFDKIMRSVSNYCCGQNVKERLENISEIDYSFEDSAKLLNLTFFADKVLHEHITNPMTEFLPCENILQKARKDFTLSAKEILQIANLLKSFRIAKSGITNIEDNDITPLKQIAGRLYINKKIEDTIFAGILNENEISDNASRNLYHIRRNIENCNIEIKEKLSDMIKSKEIKKYLQDNIVTLRNGRYVLPVRADSRQFIDGFVHDKSSSNLTFFIEPTSVLELNNKLRSLYLDETAEIEIILKDFSTQIQVIHEDIQTSFNCLEELDEIFAKAKFGRSIRGIFPQINKDGIIKLISARHPLIEPSKVVPINISIGKDYDVLVITGPNTGGKTVSIKTAGIMCLMATCGIFIPCGQGSEIAIFENIFCDIGDKQSIEESLSTFSSHIINIKRICDNVNDKSLVLLDEIGGGTDPEEGAALAISIIDYMKKSGAKLITTTHYGKIKEYCNTTNRAENASMEFDGNTLLPTYELNIGVCGNSKAFEIAEYLGLKKSIINNAYDNLSDAKKIENKAIAKADEVISKNNILKSELEQLKKQLSENNEEAVALQNQYKQKLDKITQNANSKSKNIIQENLAQIDEYMNDMKTMMQKTSFSTSDVVRGGQIRNQIEKIYGDMQVSLDSVNDRKTLPFLPNEAKLGDIVFVKSLGASGKITAINNQKKQASVSIGLMTANVKFSDLLRNMNTESNDSNVYVKHDFTVKSVKTEINILGQNTFEAEQSVERFLDEAIFSGLKEVRIVHGKGTGKLKSCVWNILKKHNSVDSYRIGNFGEGDGGVTVVFLK